MIALRHWFVLSMLLILTGLALAAWKHEHYGYPLVPEDTDESWTVQARIQLRPSSGPVKATLLLPTITPGIGRLREDFISRGFGLDIQERGNQREATWAVRRASGRQTLYYRAQFYRDSSQPGLQSRPVFPPVPELEEPFATAMRSITDDVRRQSADIASFTTEVLSRLSSSSPSEEISLFLNAPEYQGNRLEIARTLLAGVRIPTEQLNGFLLVEADRQAIPTRWLAVHNEQQWLYFDPSTGRQGIPDNLLVWWYGARPAVSVEGGQLTDLHWSLRRNEISSLNLAEQRATEDGFGLAGVSLFGLPVQAQTVYSVLMLVPVGAFLLVLLRNVVGLRALGTFMPVLIALAFRETGLVGGLVMFSLVVAVGLVFRFYLERLQLLLVPRLTAVLTIVVLLMLGMSLLSDRAGWEIGLSVGLFPMVILAMVIERMSIIWEERGPRDALIEGSGSAVIAVLAYFVMGLATVQHLVFVFPELLLVVLGLTIMMGRYSGYRITELIRFRELAGDSK